jgi:hypothetical protein
VRLAAGAGQPGDDHGRDRDVHHDQAGCRRDGGGGDQRQGQGCGQRGQGQAGLQPPGVRGALLEDGEQQPPEQRGGEADCDDLAGPDGLTWLPPA